MQQSFGQNFETVLATFETTPVLTSGDNADDPAIWIHPTNRDSSFFLGTNKSSSGRIELYNLDGSRFFATTSGKKLNNVDVRYNFPFNGSFIDIVSVSNRTNNRIEIFKIDPINRSLIDITGSTSVPTQPYGYTMYHYVDSNKFYGFISNRNGGGTTRQYELVDNGNGGVNSVLVRSLNVTTKVEGIVADDVLGYVYVAEEDVGIWKYGANPLDGQTRVLVDSVSGPRLTADVEGVTVYYSSDSTGYLIASSQGSNQFAVYELEGNNVYKGNFKIVNGTSIDGAIQTDGIDVISFPIGQNWQYGAFIAHDDNISNSSQNSNFKIVPWQSIADSLNLNIDTTVNPRCFGVNLSPSISSVGNTAFCLGDSVKLIADSGYVSYLWSNGNPNQSLFINQTDTLSVFVTDSFGCTGISSEIIVTANNNPSLFINTSSDSICFGDTANISVSGANTYLWSPSATLSSSTSASVQAIPDSSITYYVVGTDLNSCSNADSVSIVVFPLPNVFLGQDDTITIAQSITLDAGAGFSNYLWSNNAVTQQIIVDGSLLGAGVYPYSVIVTNSNSCMNFDTIVVTVILSTFKDEISDMNFNIDIYPNPGKGIFTVETNYSSSDFTIEVYDVFGKLIYEEHFFDDRKKFYLNLQGHTKGVYFIKLFNEDFYFQEKLILGDF